MLFLNIFLRRRTALLLVALYSTLVACMNDVLGPDVDVSVGRTSRCGVSVTRTSSYGAPAARTSSSYGAPAARTSSTFADRIHSYNTSAARNLNYSIPTAHTTSTSTARTFNYGTPMASTSGASAARMPSARASTARASSAVAARTSSASAARTSSARASTARASGSSAVAARTPGTSVARTPSARASTARASSAVAARTPSASVARTSTSDIFTGSGTSSVQSTRALVQGHPQVDIFWPSERLNEDDWVHGCIQGLGVDMMHDAVFNGFVNLSDDSDVCVVCNESADVAICCPQPCHRYAYCKGCFYESTRTSDMSCPNRERCNRLLPYGVIEQCADGGLFAESLANAEFDNTEDNRLEQERWANRLLRSGANIRRRYLSKLLEKKMQGTSGSNCKVLTCTASDSCPFHTLVAQNTTLPAVPCYFHPQNLICTQCNDNYAANTRHRCSRLRTFQSVEERRQAGSFPCPNCNTETQRNGGCMHMTCSQCGHHWCWYCVFHFYGSRDNSDKTNAYPTYREYGSEHHDRFHGLSPLMSRYDRQRHCPLGVDCLCRSIDF